VLAKVIDNSALVTELKVLVSKASPSTQPTETPDENDMYDIVSGVNIT